MKHCHLFPHHVNLEVHGRKNCLLLLETMIRKIFGNTITKLCSKIRYMQLKIIHRMQISPSHRNTSTLISLLEEQNRNWNSDTLSWSCSKLQKYWSDTVSEEQKVLGRHLDLDPPSLILGLLSKNLMSKEKCSMCVLLLQEHTTTVD